MTKKLVYDEKSGKYLYDGKNLIQNPSRQYVFEIEGKDAFIKFYAYPDSGDMNDFEVMRAWKYLPEIRELMTSIKGVGVGQYRPDMKQGVFVVYSKARQTTSTEQSSLPNNVERYKRIRDYFSDIASSAPTKNLGLLEDQLVVVDSDWIQVAAMQLARLRQNHPQLIPQDARFLDGTAIYSYRRNGRWHIGFLEGSHVTVDGRDITADTELDSGGHVIQFTNTVSSSPVVYRI